MVSIVDVTDNFFSGAGVGDVSWEKSQMSMSLISLLVLTSTIFSITFVIVESEGRVVICRYGVHVH